MCYFTGMENDLKRVLCLNDLSFAGGSSLAVIIPVINACGCECLPVATALYSTHTGFAGARRHLASDFAKAALGHIAESGVPVDAIYSGYLADPSAADAVVEARRLFGGSYVVHDPAFADNGRLYSGMENMVSVHRSLLRGADLVTPNLTEALVLCNSPPSGDITPAELARLFDRLDCPLAVITGAVVGGVHCNACFQRGEITLVPFEKLDISYPGTGDIFASLLTSLLLNGENPANAVKKSADIVLKSIKYTNSISKSPMLGLAVSHLVKEILTGHEE